MRFDSCRKSERFRRISRGVLELNEDRLHSFIVSSSPRLRGNVRGNLAAVPRVFPRRQGDWETAERPARAGIDPYDLLDWEEGDNIEAIEVDGSG